MYIKDLSVMIENIPKSDICTKIFKSRVYLNTRCFGRLIHMSRDHGSSFYTHVFCITHSENMLRS